MDRFDDVNTPAIAVVGLISAILVVVLVVGVEAVYWSYERSYVSNQPEQSRDLRAKNLIVEQDARLQRQGWLDRDVGRIAIPIDRSMELVVRELRKQEYRKRVLVSVRPVGSRPAGLFCFLRDAPRISGVERRCRSNCWWSTR